MRRKKIRKRIRNRFKQRGRDLPCVYHNKVYLGKRPKQYGSGAISRTLEYILETVGDVIGI